jgi:tetratricopeptide (TPR) repeat protein
MKLAKFRIIIFLSLSLIMFGCGNRVGNLSEPTQIEPETKSSETDKEISQQMIEEYAFVHQISDLKTAEFYLTHPEYAKQHPYVPTREDKAFYEKKFLEKVFPEFKSIAQKKGTNRAIGTYMMLDPPQGHNSYKSSWKSKYGVDESFKRGEAINENAELAAVLYKQNRLDDAIKSMKDAVSHDPDSPTLLYDLGVMYMKNGDNPQAIECFQRSIDSIKATAYTNINLMLHPEVYLGACVNMGLVYTGMEMYSEAVAILKEAVRFKPDDPDANLNLGITYWSMQDMDNAAKQMRKYLNLVPDDAEAHNMIGLIYYCKKLYNAALDEFRIASKLNPDEKQYSFNEALVLAWLDRHDEALEALNRASGFEQGEYLRQVYEDLIPSNEAKKLYNEGCTAMENLSFTKAIEHFNAALEIKPDMLEAHVNLGVIYGDRGERSKQIKHLKEAVRLNPNMPNVRYNLGLAYYGARNYSDAMSEFRQAVKLDPSLKDAHFKLGITLYRARNFASAAAEFEECVKLSPNWSEARLNLGTCYLKIGNTDGAIEQFKELVRLNPEWAEAYYSLGIAYMKAEELDGAYTLFQKALALNPGHGKSKDMMKEIEVYQGVK